MKVLFADAVDESRLGGLLADGHECVVEPSLSSDELVARVPGFDVLVVRSTKVTPAAIAAATTLSLIVRAGAGTDNIATDDAAANGIYVSNVPGRNATAVAELTMGLLLAVDRRIADGAADLRNDQWNKKEYSKADGVYGKTMAIVGLGSIGLQVAERAKAFGLSLVALRRPNRSPETEQRIRSIGIRLVDSEDALLADADIVSIHVPNTPDTQGLVNAEFLAKLPENAILLNTARGSSMIEADLLAALNRGLRAGLDVYPDEPSSGTADFTSAIAGHINVVGSHHIGASTSQAQAATVEGTVEVIEAFGRGDVLNCINLETSALGSTVISIRHQDRVGVLAKVFEILRTDGLNVKQMENRVFKGSLAAVAIINIDGALNDSARDALNAIDEVFGVQCVARVA